MKTPGGQGPAAPTAWRRYRPAPEGAGPRSSWALMPGDRRSEVGQPNGHRTAQFSRNSLVSRRQARLEARPLLARLLSTDSTTWSAGQRSADTNGFRYQSRIDRQRRRLGSAPPAEWPAPTPRTGYVIRRSGAEGRSRPPSRALDGRTTIRVGSRQKPDTPARTERHR